MKYKRLWSCMHDNPHHDQINQLETWYRHMKDMYDFWAIAYYPFGMIDTGKGLSIEGLFEKEVIDEDFEEVRRVAKLADEENYPMFMGYEWQGNGMDGDHNVFFLKNDQSMFHPLTYRKLYEIYKDVDCMAIPHHIAYHLNDRGKNWATHIEKFSPFAEIYSSHGCSESDLNAMDMKTHIHMGPRVENTSYEQGLNNKIKIGCICSGDNHVYPGQYDNGTMCVLAVDNSKEAIWDGLKKSRVYGVTKGRMDIDFTIDGFVMGSKINKNKNSLLKVSITGDSAIDRIEVLKDNIVDFVYIHQGKWERTDSSQFKTFKIFFEFGWGPDMRIFPDIYKKEWDFKLSTEAKIVSVQKCYNSIGTKILSQSDQSFEASIITYKSSGAGKWMGQSSVKTEGFIFELHGDVNDILNVRVDRKKYEFTIADLLNGSKLYGDLDGSVKLIKERFGEIISYRNDTWWHNAYKFKVNRAIPKQGYYAEFEHIINTMDCRNVRIKVYQRNGAVAFVSPIFMKEE